MPGRADFLCARLSALGIAPDFHAIPAECEEGDSNGRFNAGPPAPPWAACLRRLPERGRIGFGSSAAPMDEMRSDEMNRPVGWSGVATLFLSIATGSCSSMRTLDADSAVCAQGVCGL